MHWQFIAGSVLFLISSKVSTADDTPLFGWTFRPEEVSASVTTSSMARSRRRSAFALAQGLYFRDNSHESDRCRTICLPTLIDDAVLASPWSVDAGFCCYCCHGSRYIERHPLCLDINFQPPTRATCSCSYYYHNCWLGTPQFPSACIDGRVGEIAMYYVIPRKRYWRPEQKIFSTFQL